VRATLESVLKQSWQDLEIIIVNDGSTDRSMDICRQFDDPRVCYVEQANGGLASARNAGIEHARGEFLGFIDADDIWHPDKVSRHMAQFGSDPKLGVSYSWSSLMDEEGKDLGTLQKDGTSPTIFADCYTRNVIGNGSNAMLRREVFADSATESFDPDLRRAEDFELWSRIASLTHWKIACIPEVLVSYRINMSGLSSNTILQQHYHLLAMAKVAQYAAREAEQYRCSAVAHLYWHQARTHAQVKNTRPGLRAVRLAMHYDWRTLNGNHCMIGSALMASLVLPRPAYLSLFNISSRLWGWWQRLQVRFSGIKAGRALPDPIGIDTLAALIRQPESYARKRAMPNLFFLCHKHRLMFLGVSKNASTSLKKIMRREEHGEITSEDLYHIHKIWGWSATPGRIIELGDAKALEAYRGYTRFAVYRDPVSRFIAAYHNKVLYSQPEHRFFTKNRLEGMGLDHFINVTESILRIANPLHIDEHLRPQAWYYRAEDVDYIVPIERLSEFLQTEFGIQAERGLNRTLLPRIIPSENQLERIRKLYECDYTIRPNWPGKAG